MSYSPDKELMEKEIIDRINSEIYYHKKQAMSVKGISDGYHTFDELYGFRKVYNAALFNEWGGKPINDGKLRINAVPKYNVHKSWKHNDGEWCFGSEREWFIVVAILPNGQISNHYKAEDWDLFNIPETEKALFEFDGHTGEDVLERLTNICK
jgi:hypothetical protein